MLLLLFLKRRSSLMAEMNLIVSENNNGFALEGTHSSVFSEDFSEDVLSPQEKTKEVALFDTLSRSAHTLDHKGSITALEQ
jgi:hypothetical protein